jgi:hypothetical protein
MYPSIKQSFSVKNMSLLWWTIVKESSQDNKGGILYNNRQLDSKT